MVRSQIDCADHCAECNDYHSCTRAQRRLSLCGSRRPVSGSRCEPDYQIKSGSSGGESFCAACPTGKVNGDGIGECTECLYAAGDSCNQDYALKHSPQCPGGPYCERCRDGYESRNKDDKTCSECTHKVGDGCKHDHNCCGFGPTALTCWFADSLHGYCTRQTHTFGAACGDQGGSNQVVCSRDNIEPKPISCSKIAFSKSHVYLKCIDSTCQYECDHETCIPLIDKDCGT